MNLSKKTLLYSTLISILMLSLLIGYFILMLPSLYVSYMQDRNYMSAVKLQESLMKTGNYDNSTVKSASGTITIKIPLTGNRIYLLNQFFTSTVEIHNQELISFLDKLRYYADHTEEIVKLKKDDFPTDNLKKLLSVDKYFSNEYPLSFTFQLHNNNNSFQKVSSRFHKTSDKLIVYESSVTDGNNYYTNYIALGLTNKDIIITLFPVMSPMIDEIKPVILQSLPMIAAVVFLLVLISSQFFSKLIIYPIIRLSNHAKFMTETEALQLEPVTMNGHDEIASLAESLNNLYEKIQNSYQELEFKNIRLAEENKRQEVFLRASSHQLKTPISAALLLIEGMIHEVGKYKETKAYLPEVKHQLQSMKKIIDDLLSLNHSHKELEKESFSLNCLLEECLSFYHIQLEEKEQQLTIEGSSPNLLTDSELFKKILDNLISNAINYTPRKGRIAIVCEENRLCIINYGAAIKAELLPHVFEPFVSGMAGAGSHGLGLYVAAYYAKLLNCQLTLTNLENGVMAELIFA